MIKKVLLTVKSAASCAALAAALSVGAAAIDVPGTSLSPEAYAQSNEKKKTRRSQIIKNEKLIKAMNGALEMLGEDKIADAYTQLQRAPAMAELSSYERAKLYQFRGQLHAQLDRYPQAITDWEAMLREPEVSPADADSIRFNLAQVYMVEGNFPKALSILESWRKTAEVVRANQEFLFCQAYLQTEAFKKALTPCNATLTKADAEGLERRENWVVANVVAHQQNDQYDKATGLLKWLVTNYPKEQYWKQLSGMFSQRGMGKDELATFEIAYAQGFLDTESEVKRMAQLYQFHGMPIKAVGVINKGVKDGYLEENKEILELLGGSYQLARESNDAKVPLAEAARKAAASSDKKIRKDAGKLWERVAQLYIVSEQWSKAASALNSAQRAGGLSNPYRVKVYEGMSLAYSGKFSSARKTFSAAKKLAKNDKDRKQINGWLAFVDDQERRAKDRKTYGLKPYGSR
ncbi:MAG: hypothetical protein AAF337_03765 [Pseudomonadota bacterium]